MSPRNLDLREDELESDAPSAAKLARAVNQTPVPGEAAVRELSELLDRSRRDTGEGAKAAWPALLEEPRRRVDTRYAPPATSHRGMVGLPLVAAKRAFRAGFQPFINEIMRRQVEFNEAILDALATIYEQSRVNARAQALWREELDARLRKLERGGVAGASVKAPRAAAKKPRT